MEGNSNATYIRISQVIVLSIIIYLHPLSQNRFSKMFGLQVLTLAIITFVPILAVEPRVGIGDLNPSLAAEIEAIKTTLGEIISKSISIITLY